MSRVRAKNAPPVVAAVAAVARGAITAAAVVAAAAVAVTNPPHGFHGGVCVTQAPLFIFILPGPAPPRAGENLSLKVSLGPRTMGPLCCSGTE